MIALIPARKGSKGIPGKNSKVFAGLPLVEWTIKQAKKTQIFRQIVVSTDCPKVSKIASGYSGVCVLHRDPSIADDDTPMAEVIKEAISFIELNNKIPDPVCLLQPTSPLRTVKQIENCIDLFYKREAKTTVVTVQEVPHQFCAEKQFEVNNRLEGRFNNKINRRQEIRQTFSRNGPSIVVIPRINAARGEVYTTPSICVSCDKISSIDIDDFDDWLIAEAIANVIGIDS